MEMEMEMEDGARWENQVKSSQVPTLHTNTKLPPCSPPLVPGAGSLRRRRNLNHPGPWQCNTVVSGRRPKVVNLDLESGVWSATCGATSRARWVIPVRARYIRLV